MRFESVGELAMGLSRGMEGGLWSRHGGDTTARLALLESQFVFGDFELTLSCFERTLRRLEFGGSHGDVACRRANGGEGEVRGEKIEKDTLDMKSNLYRR